MSIEYSDYDENDYNDISEELYMSTDLEQATDYESNILPQYETNVEIVDNEPIIATSREYYDEQTTQENDDLVINPCMVNFFNKLYNHIDEKTNEFSELFNNSLLEDINNKKHFTEKHTKYNVDKYCLLIRENKYNIKNDACGWVFDNDEPVNIHVSDELKYTKSPNEIFDIVMTDLVRRNKLNMTTKSIPTLIFTQLGKDVSKYIKK